MSDPARIAIFLPNWIGDAVMATPALRAVRLRWPGAYVCAIGRRPALEVLQGAGFSDEEIAVGREGFFSPASRNVARRLKKLRIDLAILMPNSFRSAMLARCCGAKCRIGYARDGRAWLLTSKLLAAKLPDGKWKPYPAIDYYLDLVYAAGASCTDRTMTLTATPAGERQADELLAGADASRPIVMLNPGGAFGSSKLWPAEKYAALADELIASHGAQIIINCAPSESKIAADVQAAMKKSPLIDFGQRGSNSLTLLKSLMRRCRLLVTNDTGARHVAAAFDVPVVTLFGSTDPEWARIDYPRERIVNANVACAPCQQKVCPLSDESQRGQCMRAIEVAAVVAQADELLKLPAAQNADKVLAFESATRQVKDSIARATAADLPRCVERMSRPMFAAARMEGLDTIEGAFAYAGGDDLVKPGLGGRRRTRITLVDSAGVAQSAYLKRYVASPSIFGKICARFGVAKSVATLEAKNILAVQNAGAATMGLVCAGSDPGGEKSFIVVTSVAGDAIERCGEAYLSDDSGGARATMLTERLADLVGSLHSAGLVHRDLYASHVFLDTAVAGPRLALIDLARVFRPAWRNFRWRVKDLAQLKFSMPRSWTQNHWRRFLELYEAKLSAAVAGEDVEKISPSIDAKCDWIRRRSDRKSAGR